MTIKEIHQPTRGFSLPETIAVLAVAGISVSLAVPSYQFFARADREATAVNTLVTTLQAARGSAIARNTTVTVCPSTGGESCNGHSWEDGWVVYTNSDDATPSARNVLLREGPQAGLQIQSPEFARGIQFHANGGVSAADNGSLSGQFLFCPAGTEAPFRTVVVLPHGKTASMAQPAATTRGGEPVRCRVENHS